jgi:hypothetical protein
MLIWGGGVTNIHIIAGAFRSKVEIYQNGQEPRINIVEFTKYFTLDLQYFWQHGE